MILFSLSLLLSARRIDLRGHIQVNNLLHLMRDSSQPIGGSVGSIPSTFVSANSSSSSDLSQLKSLRGIHSTPASNLMLSDAVRNAQHDGSPSISSTRKMKASRSYSNDLRSHTESNGSIASSSSNNNINSLGLTRSTSSNMNFTLPDISPSDSQFFEVMYVGKIKVSHKRVPFSFIDDALPKFKAYDAQRAKAQMQLARRISQATASDLNNLEALEKITMNQRRYSTSDGLGASTAKFQFEQQRENTQSIQEEIEPSEDTENDKETTNNVDEATAKKINDDCVETPHLE